ncbi:MAG: biotin--[acetyl-CoA-carboxylase] ligase [candidate division Zixibacteria bacterium]|nr:biotin--[acetyl-CoA-carboxylase] ligase [candidate division Zixibacteria bacterium]
MNQVELEQLADEVLSVIRKKPEQVFEITKLAKRFGTNSNDIYNVAMILREWGYGIKLNKNELAFLFPTDTLSSTEILYYLKTKIIGKVMLSFKSIKSTNDLASQMAANYADEGVVITSEKQTLGRGRFGRSWHSPEKVGAYISIIITPKMSPEKAPGLSVMTALAAAETFEKYCPGKVKIKWPNDILLGNRKVAGVLTELYAKNNKIDYVVVGIGININQRPQDFPRSLKKIATSLRQVAGKKINRAELTAQFLKNFEKEYKLSKKPAGWFS